ncbi:MAG: tetratricopeptide repeat protein [Gemmatimonadota bacterium]
MSSPKLVSPSCSPSGEAAAIAELVVGNRYEEALEHFFELGASCRGDSLCQYWAATAAARLGRYPAAMTLASGAEAAFTGDRRSKEYIRLINLLGALALEQGDVKAAESRFRAILAERQFVEDRIIAAHALTNLASILDLRGESDGALRLYYEALREYHALEDRRGVAQTYHNINLVFRKLEMHEAGESVARLALKNAEAVGDASLIALCLSGQAENRLERGDLEGAAQSLAEAQGLIGEASDQTTAAEVGRLLALLHLRRGKVQEAVVEAEISRSIARRCGSALVAAECAAVAAIGFTLDGKPADASLRQEEATRGFLGLEAKWLRARYGDAWNNACIAGRQS